MNKFTLIDKAFFLKRTVLFGNLDLDLLLAIADKLHLITLEEGQKIFSADENAYRMYFLVKGDVQILSPDGKPLAVLHPDEFFGDEALFSEKPRTYHATSLTETTLLALSQTNLLTIISECPSVALGILQAYASVTSFRQRPSTNN